MRAHYFSLIIGFLLSGSVVYLLPCCLMTCDTWLRDYLWSLVRAGYFLPAHVPGVSLCPLWFIDIHQHQQFIVESDFQVIVYSLLLRSLSDHSYSKCSYCSLGSHGGIDDSVIWESNIRIPVFYGLILTVKLRFIHYILILLIYVLKLFSFIFST